MEGIRLVIIALFLAFVPVAHAKTYVVAAGINKYANGSRLRYCETDVANFCSIMQRQGAVVYRYTGNSATKANILAALRKVCNMASGEDAVIFFFSGHGLQGGFCPYDITSTGANLLTYGEMQRVFKTSLARRKMVFADACHSGGMRQDKSNATSKVKTSSVMFFLSSRGSEYSIESPRGGGLFTINLVNGLRGNADYNGDKYVTAQEIFSYVSSNVKSSSRNRQHPVMWGKFNNNMVISSLK